MISVITSMKNTKQIKKYKFLIYENNHICHPLPLAKQIIHPYQLAGLGIQLGMLHHPHAIHPPRIDGGRFRRKRTNLPGNE